MHTCINTLMLWLALFVVQGIGAPACAMLLTRWFAASERGTYWGLWNISTNLGGFLSPIVVGKQASSAVVVHLWLLPV